MTAAGRVSRHFDEVWLRSAELRLSYSHERGPGVRKKDYDGRRTSRQQAAPACN